MTSSFFRSADPFEQSLFQVNLAALIQLLSQHPYSGGPDVVVRKLLQNAADAITARRPLDPTEKADISLELERSTEGWLLTVIDEGIGVRSEKVESCFATICDSSKWIKDPETGVGLFLEQFGVGQLSAFMIAEEMTIISRNATLPGEDTTAALNWASACKVSNRARLRARRHRLSSWCAAGGVPEGTINPTCN